MARPHSLMLWSIVFGFLAAASLLAADAKQPKQKHAKAPAAKATPHRSDDPFAGPEKHAARSAKKQSKPIVRQLMPGENVTRIEVELASTTQLDFVETPLQDVVDYLKCHHEIEILIDNKALGDVGIGTDSPVTVSLKGITLRSALNLMLQQLSLTWTIEDEVLMITTPEEADNRLDTKVYDVADLVACRDEHDVPWEDYDTLIDVITSTIKPTTWDMVGGGPGSISGATLGTAKVLVVSETREVHEQIADLLAKIREIAKNTSNAGTPRRNKPVSPTPRKCSNAGKLNSPPAYTDPLAIPQAKAPADAGTPKQHERPPKPNAAKGRGDKGMS